MLASLAHAAIWCGRLCYGWMDGWMDEWVGGRAFTDGSFCKPINASVYSESSWSRQFATVVPVSCTYMYVHACLGGPNTEVSSGEQIRQARGEASRKGASNPLPAPHRPPAQPPHKRPIPPTDPHSGPRGLARCLYLSLRPLRSTASSSCIVTEAGVARILQGTTGTAHG